MGGRAAGAANVRAFFFLFGRYLSMNETAEHILLLTEDTEP